MKVSSYFGLLLVLTLSLIVALPINSQSQHTISYQGNLSSSGGTPLDGDYSITFSLWDAVVDGNQLWSEIQAVPVSQGFFSVELGSVVPLDPAIYAPPGEDHNLMYLQIEVGGETITPRTRISFSPWSAVARRMRGDVTTNEGQMILEQASTPSLGRIEMDLNDGTSTIALQENSTASPGAILSPQELYMALPLPLPKNDGRALVGGAYYRGDGFRMVDTTAETLMVASSSGGQAYMLLNDLDVSGRTASLNPAELVFATPINIPKNSASIYHYTKYTGSGFRMVDTTAETLMVAGIINNEVQVDMRSQLFPGARALLDPNGLVFTLPLPIPKSSSDRAAATTSFRPDGISLVDSLSDTLFAVNSNGSLKTAGFAMSGGAASGYVLTSDAFGNASWQAPSGGGSGDWTNDGLGLVYLTTTNNNVSIGSIDNLSKLYVYGTSGLRVTQSVNGSTSAADVRAFYGESTPVDYFGYGGEFIGGYVGARGIVNATGSHIYYGLQGIADGGSGSNYGVYGEASGSGTNWAGYFNGDVHVAGTLTSLKNGFVIDNPDNPKQQILSHSSVSSPDMKNIYDGIAVLDDKGEATVALPNYFESLNRDFRYQLTCIGGYAQVYIANEIADNQFTIAGGKPGMKISWQVTGIRKDAAAKLADAAVIKDKPADQQGKYINPTAYGQARESALQKSKN